MGPKAESHRKLAFDVAELRVDRLEPNPAPGNLADRDGTVAEEDRHAIAKHRADAVDAPAPPERRVTPAEPNLDGDIRRLDRQSIAPSVIADAPDPLSSAGDVAPPVPATLNREFAAVDEDPVSQDSELRLDDHTVDIQAGRHKRSPGIPGAQAFKRRVHRAASSMLLDLHNHTRYSPDSRVEPAALVELAQRVRLAGIAITDHNSVGGIAAAEQAAGRDFLVIPAIEVSTKFGHVLGYGIREIVPRDLSVSETAERIVALGGVPVAAHPFRFWSGLGPAAVAQASFPAYETCNGRTLRRGNVRARALARERKLGETGGSDSHFLDEVAKAVTAVDAGALRVDDVLQLLAQGRTSAQGLDRGPAATARYVTKAVGEWMLRGMRRI